MKEVFEKAILTYGQTAQEDVAIEEMSELIKAICKMRRAGVNEKPAATDAIVDEIADVSSGRPMRLILPHVRGGILALQPRTLRQTHPQRRGSSPSCCRACSR